MAAYRGHVVDGSCVGGIRWRTSVANDGAPVVAEALTTAPVATSCSPGELPRFILHSHSMLGVCRKSHPP